ncbi:MAG TPA: hypothetical protein VLJ79_19510 [Candidatus Binatia bacterium]|nr:hypothetical protein [Candidatus Binatia bacterium]
MRRNKCRSTKKQRNAEEVCQHLFGEKIRPEARDRASIWTDTNVYNELGIPAIRPANSSGGAHSERNASL